MNTTYPSAAAAAAAFDEQGFSSMLEKKKVRSLSQHENFATPKL